MREQLRRFLLRHRVPMGGALVGVLLAALVAWTFVLRDEEDPVLRETLPQAPPAVPAALRLPAPPPPGIHEQRQAPVIPGSAGTPTPEPEPEPEFAPQPPAPPPPEPVPQPPRVETAPVPGPSAPLRSRPLETLLGPSGGSAGRRGTTVLLGPGPLVLDGEGLHWSIHVIEGGPTHVALGILLEPLGGADTWWTAMETRSGMGPYLAAGQSPLGPELARAIRVAGARLEVHLAAFHVDGDGRRIQVGSAFASAPLTVRR